MKNESCMSARWNSLDLANFHSDRKRFEVALMMRQYSQMDAKVSVKLNGTNKTLYMVKPKSSGLGVNR